MNDSKPPEGERTTIHGTLNLGAGRWGDHVLDTYVLPKLSLLKICGAPHIEKLPNHFGTFILNDLFSGSSFKPPHRILTSNFVRRLEEAAKEYILGRESLILYLAAPGTGDGISHVRRAISHFEGAVLRLHLACVCLEGFGKALAGPPLYVVHDGSDYDRLRKLNNRIKHFDEDVLGSVSKGALAPIAPIWLTDDGFESRDAALRFDEFVEILRVQSIDAGNFTTTIFEETKQLRIQREQAETGLTAAR